MKKLFLFVLITGLFFNSFGQITTAVNPTIAQMQSLLQGNGVVVTGLNITCPSGAYATFANGAGALGGTLNSGILLTTGTASNVAGPNTSSNNLSLDNLAPGSALGNTLANSGFNGTFDGCYINFLITPSCATLSINYVFGSEEYPEYSVGSINDVFGFVLSGPNPLGGNYNQQNLAILPVTTTTSNVVSIQNVNNGTNNTGPCINCAYYIPNPPGLAYDACTPVMTASANVIPCQTYTMTIGVWDDSDGILDSGVFLDVNGLSCANQPSLTATVNPTTTCGPQTVTLTVTGGFAIGSYTWSAPASGGLAATTGSVVTANPTAATTYTVKYSDINTCPGFPVTQTVSIAFTPPPALPVSQSPAGSICLGQTATLTANGGAGTYSWTPGTFLSTTSNSLTVCTPTATTTYTVTKTVGACVSSTVITVNVISSPTIAITPSLSTICAGQSQALSASGAGPFVWTASSGAAPASVANVTVTPGTTTTYTVLSGTGTCTSSAVATVSIAPSLSVSITPSLSTICLGQSQALSASGAGPFVWTASAGANPPATGNVTVTPTATTTYTVLSGTGTCTASAIATVSISTTPSINITPSNTTICLGESVTLSSSGAGPFTWTASAGANPSSAASVTVTPTTTTTYTVLSGTGACTATALATVSIAPVAPINISPSNTTICLGESVSLTSTGTGPFTWTASAGANPASASSVTVSPTSNTTYTVLSGTGACTVTAVATVSISPTLSINITPASTIICNGQSANLSVTGSTGPFVWTASSGANPSPTGAVTVNPTTTVTYTVLAGTGACTAQAIASVSVSPTLTISIIPSNTTICSGASATLTASGTTSYIWSNGASTSSIIVNPTTNTSYTVIGTNGICTNSTSTTLNIITPTISATSSLPYYCIGIPAVSLTGSGATTYTWSGSGLSSTTGAIVTATPSATSIYTVVGETSGCAATQTISLTVPPISTITAATANSVICIGTTGTTLTATGANTYTWSPGLMANDTVAVNPLTTTAYTVAGQTLAGCIMVPAVVTVSVLPTINPVLTISSPTVCLTKTVSISAPAAAGLTYTWQPTNSISGANNTSSVVAMPPSTATVIYTVTISNGVCIGTNTVQLQIKTPPNITNFTTLNNDTICTGGCVTFSATATGSQPIFYQWFYESGIGTSSVGIAPEACYPSAGSFSVVATASNTCGFDTLVKTNFVNVFDLPVLIVDGDTTINIGETATVYASGGVSYNWSPNVNGNTITCVTCSNTVVQPTLTTQYIVVASNSPYCKVQDTVTVIVDINCGDFFIPNVFSPNDDGLNDVINVHGRCISTFNLQIFNRWGEKVFETTTLENSWDGTFRGKKMDTGVFVYKADGVSIDGQSFKMKGNITLIR
jgi:gliding motility-associated-like protein